MTSCISCGCENVKKARTCVRINGDLLKKAREHKINMSKVLEYKLCELVGRFESKKQV